MQISMDGKKIRLWPCLALSALAFFLCPSAMAAVVELSAMISYTKEDLPNGYKSTQHRYTGTVDFKFTQVSAIEFEYTDSRTNVAYPTTVGTFLPIATTETVLQHDRVYSINWVQNLVPSKWILQPYFVIGGGRMVQKYADTIPTYGITVQEFAQDVTVGTGGLGCRLFFTHNMALKAEAKTYVPKFHFRDWKQDEQLSIGLSWSF
jgi:hypothetical protein